jgi:Uma2 family endonuclease
MEKDTQKVEPEKYPETKDATSRVEEPMLTYGIRYNNPDTRYTYADYLSWEDDIRREICNGIVWLMSAPTRFHAKISGSIVWLLSTFIKKRRKKAKGMCEIYDAPFDVRLPKNGETADNKIYTVVQPDICIVCDPSKLDDKGCIGAPDMVVEIISPSTGRRDLDYKLHLYEEAGVREYWVVYPESKGITVFLLREDGTYDNGIGYQFDVKIPVHIFGDVEFRLKELFGDE